MLEISYDNITAQMSGDKAAESFVRSLLSYQKDGYWFSRAYREGRWDGIVRLVNYHGVFAAGLLPYVCERLRDKGYEYSLIDRRPPLPPPAFHVEFPQDALMPHQAAAVQAAVSHERGIISHPTAAGKTRTAAAIIAAFGQRALLLTHRKDIMQQLFDTAREFLGDRVGVVGAGLWEPREVTVASFQALAWHLRHRQRDAESLLKSVGTVVVDEAHHLPAKTFQLVMRQTTLARYRIGLSATPFKTGHDKDAFFHVQSWLGPVIHEMSFAEGVDIGRLVPATVIVVRPTWPHDDSIDDLPWPEQYAEGIVDNEARNSAIIELVRLFQDSLPVLVLVDRIEHGERLAKALDAPFLRGETQLQRRKKVWDGLRQGKVRVVVATKIADEGVDIPGIGVLVLAGGGKARHLLIQRIGRGMRASLGKEGVLVFDFLDQGRHLNRHANERLYLYAKTPAYTYAIMTLEEVRDLCQSSSSLTAAR